MNTKLFTLIIFLAVYLYLIFFKRYRALGVWVGILILWFGGVVGAKMMIQEINWNVLGIFAGTLIIAELFIRSKVPVRLTDLLVDRSKTVGMAILWICILTGFISAFVENVATVLIVAPLALELAKRMKTSPVPFLIGIAICSNLQGTATLIGDPPSMILAGYESLTFNDFFFYRGRPSIFFAVELGAILSMFFLYLFYRRNRERVAPIPIEVVRSWVPTILLISMIIALAFSSILDPGFTYLGGIVCLGFGGLGLFWQWRKERTESKEVIKGYDWETTFFLAGIFVLVGALKGAGIIEEIANLMRSFTGASPFWNFTVIVWFSVLFSAFIDNVPYITAMIPVCHILADSLSLPPTLFVFGLLIGSCLGGNITPIGAAANITAMGMARKRGYQVGFIQFARIGLPFTILATLSGYLFVWFIWR